MIAMAPAPLHSQHPAARVTLPDVSHDCNALVPSTHAFGCAGIDCKPWLRRRGLPKEVQIPSEPQGPQKLLIESFAAQHPPPEYHQELPRKLEIWLVPKVPAMARLTAPRGARKLPANPIRHVRCAQKYEVHTETGERDPVPSLVLVHYTKEDEPISNDVPAPVSIESLLVRNELELDEDESEPRRGWLFQGFNFPPAPQAASPARSGRSPRSAASSTHDTPLGPLVSAPFGGAAPPRPAQLLDFAAAPASDFMPLLMPPASTRGQASSLGESSSEPRLEPSQMSPDASHETFAAACLHSEDPLGSEFEGGAQSK